MSDTESLSQWQCLLLNLGTWQGSFTRLSSQGEIAEDIPSIVTLEGLNGHQTIRQTIQHFSPDGEPTYNKELEYSTLGRSVLFFENGAFSQGSLQFAPFAEFGAEMGFIQGDRRLRLVELFDQEGNLASLTLIREHRQHTPRTDRPPLTIEQLLGTWQGEVVTIYPDWRNPTRSSSTLAIWREGDRLHQRLSTAQIELASSARIERDRLLFDQGRTPMQVLLLPDGASANTPLSIPKGQPFLLEAGWLVTDTLRQRMIRSYDDKGGWLSLTLVTEQKISP